MNAVVTVLYLAEDERGRLAGVEHELGSDALQDDLVGPAGEVESRPTVEAEADRPAHRPHYSNDLVDLSDLARALDRHEIHNFTDALVAKKPRHQDVAVRHVHLFVLRLVETGDAE
jgi:hypothetical protein